MFPKLTPAEIDRLLRFGKLQRYGTGQPLFVTGESAPGMFVLRSGRVQVKRGDRLGSLAPIVEEGAGETRLRKIDERPPSNPATRRLA
jgi:thioredoxin reductase (NADPH)